MSKQPQNTPNSKFTQSNKESPFNQLESPENQRYLLDQYSDEEVRDINTKQAGIISRDRNDFITDLKSEQSIVISPNNQQQFKVTFEEPYEHQENPLSNQYFRKQKKNKHKNPQNILQPTYQQQPIPSNSNPLRIKNLQSLPLYNSQQYNDNIPKPNQYTKQNEQQRDEFTPENDKQQISLQDQTNLNKQFVFIIIFIFLVINVYYSILHKMEYMSLFNLFICMLWVTISPHHKYRTGAGKQNKQLLKSIRVFVKQRTHHLSVSKPLFFISFVNLVAIDLGVFKLLIMKLGLCKAFIENTPFLNSFFKQYVDTRFVTILQTISISSWQTLVYGFSRQQVSQQNPNQFFLITTFKFISKIFYYIFVILSAIWSLFSGLVNNIVLDGKQFLYLAIIVLSSTLALRNFFKVSPRIQAIIQRSIAQAKQTHKQDPINTPRTQKAHQQDTKPIQQTSKVKKKTSILSQDRRRLRISAVGSSYSNELQFMKNSQQIQDSPIYIELSKYLLLFSLIFIYAFCFLASDQQKFLFFDQFSVKQVWSVVVCLYSFLIVEYCKYNDRYIHKDAKEEFRFWIKCNIVKLLVIILILHDFFISKKICQAKLLETSITSIFQCFNQQTQYIYFLKSFFFNSHDHQTVPEPNQYKLNFFVDFGMKIVILVNLRLDKFYLFKNKRRYPTLEQQHKLIDDGQSSVQNLNLGDSSYTNLTLGGMSTQSYKLKKKFNAINKSFQRNTLILLILTIVIMTLTNSISNVIVLFGVFINIPTFEDRKFRKYLMTGLSIGLLIQPDQFLYFILAMLMVSIRGKNYNFSQHSHWVLIQISRLYILFSKVSVINFLMGLMPSAVLVMYCLVFRIVFNYFGWISVFMGTEDNYARAYFYNLVPHSVFVDAALWTFMILFKTYTPNLVHKFKDCDITDIFKEYPVTQKIQPALKILKIIQLVAYIAIELIVFTEAPSIIVFIRLFMHLIIAAVDLAYEKANETLKNLWKVNLYVSLFIAFLKYFYLLNRYQNLSNWLIALLEPLENNWSIIGLWRFEGTQNIFSLMTMFLPDICIIVLSMLVQYTLQVKIFEAYRQVFVHKSPPKLEHEDSNSEDSSPVSKLQVPIIKALIQPEVKQSYQNEAVLIEQPKKYKDIQYLYKNYIKDLRFKLKSTSIIGRILSDFLYDIYFLLFCGVYLIFEDKATFSGFWLNLPHFIIAYVIFIHQQDRKLPLKTFNYSIIYCCATILLLYFKYLYSYVTYEQETMDQISFFRFTDILNKYILFLLGCLFYKLHDALKEQLEISKMQQHRNRLKNIVYMMLMPAFEKVFDEIKEITILWAIFWKSTILALFVANCFASSLNFIFSITMLIFLIVTIKYPFTLGYHNLQSSLMHYWIYPFLLSFCFTIWNQNLIGYLGLIAVRVYIIFYTEYELEINLQNCQYVSESQKDLVEYVDNKFNHIEKLSIIPQEKEGCSKVNQSSENEQQKNNWHYSNLYQTILLIVPHGCLLLMLCSQLVMYKNYFSAFMSLSILTIFFYAAKFIQEKTIFTQGIKKKLKIYFGINFLANFFVYEHIMVDLGQEPKVHIRLGVFLLCIGFFYFMYLVQDTDPANQSMYLISHHLRVIFMKRRYDEILRYWQKKRELVSQLGCQIHNEKKLLKLQKFYISKQKISRRVQKLTQDIQQRGRNNFKKNLHSTTDFEVIDQILDYKQEGTQYELYTNMLLLLSIEDLQYCLQMMNHYYRPCVQTKKNSLKMSRNTLQMNGQMGDNMAQEMKEIRANVLNIYHGSIYLAFKQYKQSIRMERREKMLSSQKLQSSKFKIIPFSQPQVYFPENDDGFSSVSDEEELVDFEKSELMNQKYVKCMQRIHEKSMEINWVWRKFIQNSQIISLVIVTGWNFFGGVYAIPANFAIFTWALVLQTKTTVFLWSFFFLYAGFIIMMKFLLPQLPDFPVINFIFYYYSGSCYYETIIMIVSSLQIFLIKLGGTEYKSYSERQTIYDAFYRRSLNKAAHKIKNELEQQFIEVYKILSQPSEHSFFYRVFSKSRLKPGKDFYPLMSGIQLLILMYVFFFYDMMEFQSRNNRKSLGEILTVNQFSKNMMIVLFTQVIIMIVDRCIASLNFIDIKNQVLENFLLNFAFSDHIKYRAPKDVTHVGFFDFLLIVKYLFHIFLMIIVNFFVYFYIPSSGFEKSLIPQCQNSTCGKSYTYLSIFLLLYLSYFVVSGLQIKHGFSRDKCRNKLMEKYHWIDYYVYVIFTGIPFLWEFKKICDWTITTTALPLFHWLKFEDINGRLYQSKCEAQMLKIKPRAKTPLSKYILGPAGCMFILGVVFSPLLLYSSLNPFAVKDEVLAAQVRLNLLVNGSVQYKFFSTSHAVVTQNLSKFPEQYQDEFDSGYKIKSSIDFEDNNDFYLKMSSYPDENFKISQPAIQKLSARIQRAISRKRYRFFDMVMHTKIIEKEGGQNEIQWARKRLNNTDLKEFIKFIQLNTTDSNNSTTPKPTSNTKYFRLQKFYSPIPGTIENKTVCLMTKNQGQYYELYTLDKDIISCQQIQKRNEDQNPGILLFYSSSTKYKVSFGLITFYVTYVLLISRLFRSYLTGNLDNVIYEGCHLERMLILCDAVRQARILENLDKEQYLYAFLVDLIRSPRTLKEMSGEFTQMRKKLSL